jgi:hypothetical protein
VPRSFSAVAFNDTFTADVFVAVITAILRSAVPGSNVVFVATTAIHLANATLVEVVLLWRLRGRYNSRSRWFLFTDQWHAFIPHFFLLNKFVVRLNLFANDDLLGFAALFSDYDRLATFLSYYDRRLRCRFSYNDGLGLLIVFSLLPVSLNLGLMVVVMVRVVWVWWRVVSLAFKSVLADSLLRGWGGCTNGLSVSFWEVEVAATGRDVVTLDHTIRDVTPRRGRLGFRDTFSDMPLVVATPIVSAITLGDAEVNLGARLGRWRVFSSLALDDDLIIVDFLLLPPISVRDLVALDGGVWTACFWVSFGLATAFALAIDDALASDRHGGCLEVGGG